MTGGSSLLQVASSTSKLPYMVVSARKVPCRSHGTLLKGNEVLNCTHIIILPHLLVKASHEVSPGSREREQIPILMEAAKSYILEFGGIKP